MSNFKKFASILLVLILALTMAAPAMALRANDGSITITNPVAGSEYKAYLMFELESYNEAKTAYSYKITPDWRDFVEKGYGKDYFEIDGQDYVTLKKDVTIADDSETAAALAKEALAYAKSKGLEPTVTLPDEKTGLYAVTGLALGYYVIDSSTGALCALTTTDAEAIITEKNGTPENDKKVEEDSLPDEVNKDKDDAEIGQIVNFMSTVVIPANSTNIVFHDHMSAGLTLNDGVKVYTDWENKIELGNNNYTFTKREAGAKDSDEKDCTFEVSFTKEYLDSLTETTTTLYVGYSATLNEHAVIAGDGNPNTSRLSYGDETKTIWTPDSVTKTYTWKMDVYKFTSADGATPGTPLAGAKFNLTKEGKQGAIKLVKITDGSTQSPVGADVYRLATETDTATVTEIVTNASGKFEIQGLDGDDKDKYYLTEVEPPMGYNKLPGPIQVKVVRSGDLTTDEGNLTYEPQSVSYNASNATNHYDGTPIPGTVNVLNQTGVELPSTGGIGTTIFYVVGSILLVGAAVILISKRRMNAEK